MKNVREYNLAKGKDKKMQRCSYIIAQHTANAIAYRILYHRKSQGAQNTEN